MKLFGFQKCKMVPFPQVNFILILQILLILFIPSETTFALETYAAGTCWPMWQHGPEHNGRTEYAGADIPELLWEFPLNGTCETGITVGPAGNLYFGSNLGQIYSLTPNGKLRWSFSTQGPIRGQPLIDLDGILYLGSFDHNMYSIDIQTGLVNWLFTTGFSIASSPAIDIDGNIYFGSHDRHVYCLHHDGTLKWSQKTEGNISVSSPTLSEDGFLYIAGYTTGLMKLRQSDGEFIWKFLPVGTGALRNTAAIGDDGTIFIGSRNGIFFAVTPDGEEKWRFQAGGEIRSSAAIGPDGTVYFGCHDSYLYALNPENGNLLWASDAGGPVDGSPIVDGNGVIYIGGSGGRFRAFYPDGTLKLEFGPKVVNGCVSIDANGTMYAGGEFGVFAYGWPRPKLELKPNKTELKCSEQLDVSLHLSNPGPFDQLVDVKVWMRKPIGAPINFFEERALLMESCYLDSMNIYSHIFAGDEDEGAYFIGAKMLNADSGDIISESKFMINFHCTMDDAFSQK